MAKKIKNKFSSETKKIVEKRLKEKVNDTVMDAILEQKKSEKNFNKIIYFIGIIGPLLAAIFQAVKIYTEQSSAGVSLVFWWSYLVVAAMWLGFGIYNKNKPLIVTYSLWIIVQIIILNEIYFFG